MTYLQTDLLHEFHFVMGREMKEKLKSAEITKGTGGLSFVIVQILKLLTPVLKREHKWGIQRLSRYMHVTDNPDEAREHIHVYLPGDLYRRLKLMHQDLNTYSIAQLVREICEVFLGFVELYGKDVINAVKRLFRRWNKEEQKTRLTFHEFVRQLRIILQHLPGQNRLVNVYDRQFSPFFIFRL